MVFSTTKKVGLPNFGEKLKKAREAMGLSKEKAALLLNSQVKYIERLENNDWDKLPSEVYLKGILRRYARVLELDADSIISEYINELKIAHHLVKSGQNHKTLPLLRSPKFVLTPKAITFILGGLLFLFVAGYLVYQISFLVSPPGLEISQPQSDFSTDRKELEIIGRTDGDSSVYINGQSVVSDREGNFKQELELNPGLNTIKIEAINGFKKSSSVVRQIILR